jgi:hypothetical protein
LWSIWRERNQDLFDDCESNVLRLKILLFEISFR